MAMLTAERWRWNRQVRARNPSRTGARDAEAASRCTGVFVGATGRTGDADRRGNREDSKHTLRPVPSDEDREGGIRRGNSRVPGASKPAAANDRRGSGGG